MKLISEYLVIIEKKASEALFHLCDSVEEFNRLLQKEPDIVIENNIIKYKRQLDCRFSVKTGEVEGREQRFFKLRLPLMAMRNTWMIILVYSGPLEV